jgi:hypothetical protein
MAAVELDRVDAELLDGRGHGLFLDVPGAAQVAEHEIAIAIRDVVERYGGERLDERAPVLGPELVLDTTVDDDRVSGAEMGRLV